jgi:hypothetical protein
MGTDTWTEERRTLLSYLSRRKHKLKPFQAEKLDYMRQNVINIYLTRYSTSNRISLIFKINGEHKSAHYLSEHVTIDIYLFTSLEVRKKL